MSSKDSYLSDPRCQCDFVVGTTQASINSGLWEYLYEESQPVQYLCFLADDDGYPTVQISLDDLMVQSGGINPFFIPDDADSDNPQVSALANSTDFSVGVMLQMGLPEGHTPQTLPPIVTLNTASNVAFNLYCKQIKVVSIKWGRRGKFSWNVFKQPVGPSGTPWTMKMSVDLTIGDLDKKLNTPYFNNHPKLRDQLLKALENLSDTAFSLQQLLFDLDNALLETIPDFSGVTDEDARNVLENYFRDIYVKNVTDYGLPLVSITAVTQGKDDSTLKLTGFERIVNPLKDGNGNPISNPTDSQRAVYTLDHLCATNSNPVPRITGLDWNWVQPAESGDHSGAVAINRNILTQFISSKLEKLATSACFTSNIYDDHIEFTAEGTPVVTTPPSGSNTIHMSHSHTSDSPQHFSCPGSDVLVQVDTEVYIDYALDVFFEGTTLRTIQNSQIGFSSVLDMNPYGGHGTLLYMMKVVDKTLTDTFAMSVDQSGSLQLVKSDQEETDQSDTEPTVTFNSFDYGDSSIILEAVLAAFDMEIRGIQVDIAQSSAGILHELQISTLQNFVFPGGKVFTYKDPFFSDHQDLVCKITYVDPEEEPQYTDDEDDTSDSGSHSPLPPPEDSSSGRLTASSELIQNYVQGEIVSPTDKFESLQTSEGHTILFSCDTSGVFHAIEEQSGNSHTGWKTHDLSTVVLRSHFPDDVTSAKVRTFDVGQSALDGTIGLMMAVSLDDTDHLFISLGNSSESSSWVDAPTWINVPFDAANEQLENLIITGTMFAETMGGVQYLVVDIDRSGITADPHISRYHIDPSRSSGQYWVKHDVTVDISAGRYQSAVGRVSGKPVDGIYTAGYAGGSAQLIYEPIINWYGGGPATPITLQTPGRVIPSAIATTRNEEGSSDLYVIAGSTLYRFAADEQEGDFEPTALVTSDVIAQTDTLRAMNHDGVTTLWGRTGSDEVYYISCETSQLYDSKAWKPPVPLLSEVERMSTYINRVDGGNTIFTAGNGRLQKIVQDDPDTGGLWRSQNIMLASPPDEKSTSFKSYTTTIHITQKDAELPASNTTVRLSAHSRIPVYINGLYYVISPAPIQISTDAGGSLTIIDTTEGLNAAVLTVSVEDDPAITINPMRNSMDKLTSLNSTSKLRDAQFPSTTVAGGVVGSPDYTHLVDPSVNDDDVSNVANHLDVLSQASAMLESPGTKSLSAKNHRAITIPHTTTLFSFEDLFNGLVGDFEDWAGKLADTIGSLAGDVWSWMKHNAEALGQLVKDAATGTLHFFAQIGDSVYHAVLDTMHAIAGAAEWIYKKIKTGIQDLLGFLEMLFEWDDIRRSKDVIHNAFKLWMQHQVDYLPKAKDALDQNIDAFKQGLTEWTQNTDTSAFGGLSQNPISQNTEDPNKDQTSGSKLFATHYQNHANEVQYIGGCPEVGSVEDLINDLLAVISQEGAVLDDTFNQLTTLAQDLSSLSAQDALKRAAAILLGAAFSSVQVVVDALLNVLYKVSETVLTILDAPIRVPIISDILDAVFPNFKMLSFLDLICWIAAMGFTVVHKIIEGSVPFPKDNVYVQDIISAGTWEQLEDACQKSDLSFQKTFFKATHSIAALLALVGNPISSAEAMSEAGSLGMLSTGATVIKVVATGCQTIGDILVPRYPVKNEVVQTISHVTTCLGILTSIVFSTTVQSKLKAKMINSLSVADPRGVGAIVDVILVVPRLAVTGWHFYELTKDSTGATLTAAILGEVSSLASYASKISYAVAVNDEDPDSRLIAVTAKAACDDLYSGLQVAESIAGFS
ncbi:hypothetical protein FMEXI_8647 [Fusarium mexicanum]|uniref:Uncharacterized protein n=1 Tax=Fusarium mexicanum TaxID=751941 RepID=A0A8H5IQ70_9HYPO|nr:hypothetical protein FMEXI_8647 [Fusarium mexicanum]